MLEVADATHSSDALKIVDHLILKLKSPAFEYRRILKSLNAIDFLLKHGSLNGLGKLQMQGQQTISQLQSFDYKEDGADRGR